MTTTLSILCAVLMAACVLLAYRLTNERKGHLYASARVAMLTQVTGALDAMVKKHLTRVDPWESQRELMRISDQRIPGVPTLTKNSLLYSALIMEEAAETFTALYKALLEQADDDITPAGDTALVILRSAGIDLEAYSKNMRANLEGMPGDWEIPLEHDQAVEILDGTTDIAVVNSGFALACGLPGAAAYADVAGSNYSKRNPDTGIIDKDPSGKWIKGRDYRMPNLAAVLMAAGTAEHVSAS